MTSNDTVACSTKHTNPCPSSEVVPHVIPEPLLASALAALLLLGLLGTDGS